MGTLNSKYNQDNGFNTDESNLMSQQTERKSSDDLNVNMDFNQTYSDKYTKNIGLDHPEPPLR